MERLDEEPSLVSLSAQFPPNFEPKACKPLFPPLDDRVEQKKQGGITNFVRGWLGGWKWWGPIVRYDATQAKLFLVLTRQSLLMF
ncbi:hypothetical protein JTE90_023048 [Oedothorax gibbosus]|uniref:Uncharacterized protein n=1 Tax=Oedothorax gibbosus TaxID=931172 RepID=A0AAV6V2K0_9ARAC|nr:hypothetical protein JTE90_023048 [Oedothorax gibbosus]